MKANISSYTRQSNSFSRLLAPAAIALALLSQSNPARSTCFDGGIYIPTANSTASVSTSIEKEKALFNIDSRAYVVINECGWASRKPTNDPVGICLNVRTEAGRTFNFTSASALVVKYNAEGTHPDSPSQFELQIPTDRITGATLSEDDPYLSDPKAPFKPVVGAVHFLLKPFIPRHNRLEEKKIYTKLPEHLFDKFSLKLPAVNIDGSTYELPEVRFTFSSERMCWFTP